MNHIDDHVIPAGFALFCGILGVFLSLGSLLFPNSGSFGIMSNKTGAVFYLIVSLFFLVCGYGYLKGKNWASNLGNFTLGIMVCGEGVYQLTSRSTNIDSIRGIFQLVGGIILFGIAITILRRPKAE